MYERLIFGIFLFRTRMANLCWSLIYVVGLTNFILSDAVNQVDLGHLKLGVCREERIDFVWKLPANQNISEIYNIDFLYAPLPTPEDPYPVRHVLLSKTGNGNWQATTAIKRYIGRIFPYSGTNSTSFYLDNVLIKDRGDYSLSINAKGVYYRGTALLRVFAEDNLWPDAVGNMSDVAESTADGATQYRYTFSMPGYDTPIVAVEMVAKDKEGQLSERKSCLFYDNITKCDIVFTMKDFKELSRTLVLDVIPLYETGTPDCQNLNQFNNLFISILPEAASPSPGLYAGLVVCVLVVTSSCVLPPVLLKIRKNRYKCIPLTKGRGFVEYCTMIIQDYESWEDLRRIYREYKPRSQVEHFVEEFQKRGELGEEYVNERGLMAAAIKLFLREEKTPWIELDIQRAVTHGERNYMLTKTELDVATVKRLLDDVTSDNKMSLARRDIIRHLLKHFKWLASEQQTFPPNCQVVDLEGLAVCFSPIFFKEVNNEMMSAESDDDGIMLIPNTTEISQRQQAFMLQIITHVSEIFE